MEGEQFKTKDETQFPPKITEQVEINLESLRQQIREKLERLGLKKEDAARISKEALDAAKEVERMANSLAGHPALAGFVRMGSYLQNTNRPDFLSVYMPQGERFLEYIKEGILPKIGKLPSIELMTSRRPKDRKKAMEEYWEKISILEFDIKVSFNTVFQNFSKILKRETVSVSKYNDQDKSWDESSENLG